MASGTAPTPFSPLPPLGLTTFHKLSGQHPTLPGPRTNPSPSHSLLLAVSSRKSSARPGPGGDSAGPGWGPGRARPRCPRLRRSQPPHGSSGAVPRPRVDRRQGFRPPEPWPHHKDGERMKLTKLFAVGTEVHGRDRSFVALKIPLQNGILLGRKSSDCESRCSRRTRASRGQRGRLRRGPAREPPHGRWSRGARGPCASARSDPDSARPSACRPRGARPHRPGRSPESGARAGPPGRLIEMHVPGPRRRSHRREAGRRLRGFCKPAR